MADMSRRKFITGLTTLLAAPAIVRASSLMPVRNRDRIRWIKGLNADYDGDTLDGRRQMWSEHLKQSAGSEDLFIVGPKRYWNVITPVSRLMT